jgi:nicotinate-nucleotide adenylyltransferase
MPVDTIQLSQYTGILFVLTATTRLVVARGAQQMSRHKLRIGIYSGVFNPVHTGHMAFALQAMAGAHLDRLYFMPERRPRNKQNVEHFAHRVAMLNRAIRPHSKFGVLELVDVDFTVKRTLPKLQNEFTGAQLVFLHGSDDVLHVPEWPYYQQYLQAAELVVGVRNGYKLEAVKQELASWSVQPLALTIFESYAPDISSGKIREGLRSRQPVRGLLQSVARYSNRHWLYISLR